MRSRKLCKNLLLLVLVLFVTACGNDRADGIYTSYTTGQIAEAIIAEQKNIAPMNSLTPDDEFFWDYITERYRLDIDEIEIVDGIIFYAGGVIVDEIAVLLLADKADGDTVSDLLLAYADRRRIAFSGYAPIQAGILADAIVRANGYHIALLITEDPRGAESTFLKQFTDIPQIAPIDRRPQQSAQHDEHYYTEDSDTLLTNDYITEYNNDNNDNDTHNNYAYNSDPDNDAHGDDAYDRRAVLHAWNTGDTSGLTPMNRRVFDKCTYVINSVTTEDMDEFDKQLAILNWIIMWSVYDPEFLSNAPTANPNPNNDNPYGVLMDRVGNCFGFTYTFQLFMDLLGIESMAVHGYDFTGGRHSWNLVNIGDRWYAVDVTLDVTLNNPLGVDVSHQPQEIEHRHLNLTSEYLWTILGHYWDWFSVPIAE